MNTNSPPTRKQPHLSLVETTVASIAIISTLGCEDPGPDSADWDTPPRLAESLARELATRSPLVREDAWCDEHRERLDERLVFSASADEAVPPAALLSIHERTSVAGHSGLWSAIELRVDPESGESTLVYRSDALAGEEIVVRFARHGEPTFSAPPLVELGRFTCETELLVERLFADDAINLDEDCKYTQKHGCLCECLANSIWDHFVCAGAKLLARRSDECTVNGWWYCQNKPQNGGGDKCDSDQSMQPSPNTGR